MAKSSIEGKTWVKELFPFLHRFTPIKTVLDVGTGTGTYANFLRTGKQNWTGVEVWGPLIESFELDKTYDKIILADARTLDFPRLGRFDIAILGGLLEHMTKEEAVSLVGRVLTQSRFVVIALPLLHTPRARAYDNPFEATVKPDWTDEEVKRTFRDIHASQVDGSIGSYALAKDPLCQTLLTQFQTVMEKAAEG